jgi:hypothetical protein
MDFLWTLATIKKAQPVTATRMVVAVKMLKPFGRNRFINRVRWASHKGDCRFMEGLFQCIQPVNIDSHIVVSDCTNARDGSNRERTAVCKILLKQSLRTERLEGVWFSAYSQEGKTELVGYFWSGKHGRAVKGVCLVTLVYTDRNGARLPVNFRLMDKAEGKTKNELFREMVTEVLGWGLRPALVSADSWYPGLENLKFLRQKRLGFLIGLVKEPYRQRTRAGEPSTCRWKAWRCPTVARWCICARLVL